MDHRHDGMGRERHDDVGPLQLRERTVGDEGAGPGLEGRGHVTVGGDIGQIPWSGLFQAGHPRNDLLPGSDELSSDDLLQVA